MVEPSDTMLPYAYTALAPNNNNNNNNNNYNDCNNGVETTSEKQEKRTPLKTALIICLSLMICAYIMSILDVNYEPPNNVNEPNKHNDEPILRPSPENLAGIQVMSGSDKLLFNVSRGKPHGVSEKATALPLRGLRTPVYDWSDQQLSWQRTAFHFQPQKNWMNDPNGPLYYNGWYHFFYQYNPGGAIWGNIVWGHAVSKDLINWKHLPIAMVADRWYDFNGVWTGSATILPDGQIMMLYTGSTNESVQVQNLAYPADLSDPYLTEWVKDPANPILVPPPGIDKLDFRDPTTAWLTSEGKWRIAIGSKVNKTGITLVYDTSDFKNYKLLSNILHAVQGTGMWECVDFYPVSKTESNGLDTSVNDPSVKHVLKASMDDDRNDYYALGTYHEASVTWIPDDASIDVGYGLRYDYGKFYASKTFYDQQKKRRVLWGWITEGDSEAADVKKGWASLQAIPRTVLYDQKTKTNLLQWPVEEIETLRQDSKEFNEIEVSASSVVKLDVNSATEIDIVAEFSIEKKALENLPVSEEKYSCPLSKGASQRGALGPFGILVLADNDQSEQTPVYFYIIKTPNGMYKTFFCTDLSRSSLASDVVKYIYGSTVPVLDGEKLTMRVLVDHSIVEAFAQGGRTCITSRVYPTKAIYKDAKLYLFNNATEASVTASVKTWQMSSARNLSYSLSVHLIMILSASFFVGRPFF